MKIPRVVSDGTGSALAIVREVDLKLLEDCTLLTQSEAKHVRDVLKRTIDDYGFIVSHDPAFREEEDQLRSKFGLALYGSGK